MRKLERRARAGAAVLLLGFMGSGCAALGLNSIVQPPRFAAVEGRPAELRLLGPSSGRPLGGASIRLWARVENPNAFGVTLAALAGNLFLEGTRAAEVRFPLGLPLLAGGDTIVPLDVNISFADVPDLAGAAQRIFAQNRVAYRVDGTVTLDAAPFGQPSFGPSTWLRGETAVTR
jgi:hypothetical protein